jgi:hypothetical protein
MTKLESIRKQNIYSGVDSRNLKAQTESKTRCNMLANLIKNL